MRMLSAALALADRGFAVFPLGPRSKFPLIPEAEGGHGFHDATHDTAIIRAWWTRCPSANIGIATGPISGVWVLDVDADAELDALRGYIGKPLQTLTASTGKGRHLYFQWPADRQIGNRIGLRLGGQRHALDVRADGGYVAAPPSIHPLGKPYRWIKRMAPVPAPWALLELVTMKEPVIASSPIETTSDERTIERARKWLAKADPAISYQGGHATTFRVTCRLFDFGLDESAVRRLLVEEFNPRCDPEWSPDELEHKVRQAAKAERRRPDLRETRG